MRGERIEIPLVIGGKDVDTGKTQAGRDAARPASTCSPTSTRAARSTCSRRSRPPRRRGRTGRAGRGRSAPPCSCARPSCSPGPWRDTLNAATMLGQSKTAHQAEIDAACELDRLPALQRRVHDADLRRAAGLVAGHLEPARVPAARGLRLRRLAVQLHRDRRQPAELARADGQRRRLEARRRRRCSRPTT